MLRSDVIEERGYVHILKNLLIITLLLLATPAWAQHRGNGNGNRWGNQGNNDPRSRPIRGDLRRRGAVTRARRASLAAHASRRRCVDPSTCERDDSGAELEVMMVMDEYRRRSGRVLPTWGEVLEVLKDPGYEKASGPADLPESRVGPAGRLNPQLTGRLAARG
jgi:hypothetical protein